MHYTYARLSGGQRRYTLNQDLSSSLYTAILGVAQQRAVQIGIRHGSTILFHHSQLVALHNQFAAQFRRG
jgi:hypothetical protein